MRLRKVIVISTMVRSHTKSRHLVSSERESYVHLQNLPTMLEPIEGTTKLENTFKGDG